MNVTFSEIKQKSALSNNIPTPIDFIKSETVRTEYEDLFLLKL